MKNVLWLFVLSCTVWRVACFPSINRVESPKISPLSGGRDIVKPINVRASLKSFNEEPVLASEPGLSVAPSSSASKNVNSKHLWEALGEYVRIEASALHIPDEMIPQVDSRLEHNRPFYNNYLTFISTKLLRTYPSSIPTLLRSILLYMCDNYGNFSGVGKPDVSTFNIVLDSFAKTKRVEEAEVLFKSMQRSGENELNAIPDTVSYNIILNMYAKNNDLAEVLRIFHEDMSQRKGDDKVNASVNLITCNTVLQALAKSKRPQEAEHFLDKMTKEYHIVPDIVSYTTVIDAYAESGDASNAEALVKSMLQEASSEDTFTRERNGHIPPQPSIETFNSVLKAWSRSHENNAAQRAHSLLTLMIEMSSFLNISKYSKQQNMQIVDKNFSIPKPNIISFNTVLSAYSQVGDGLGAEDLLNSMIKEMEDGESALVPDVISFNTVMGAYARSGHLNCHKDAIRIIDKMTSTPVKYRSTKTLSPDVWTYTTLIDAYARCGDRDAPFKAEDVLFKTMKERDICPNVSTYNALMNAWVQSNLKGSAINAHKLLLYMLESSNTGTGNINYNVSRVEPNAKSYTTVINAYAKSSERDAPKLAEELLSLMEERFASSRDPSFQPNVLTYTSVINAWGRSEKKGKAEQALRVLNHMKDRYENGGATMARPNVYAYNAVLNACAYTFGDSTEKVEAFRIACFVFDECRKNSKIEYRSGTRNKHFNASLLKTNHVTYGTFLRCCACLMPKDEIIQQRTLVEAIFRKCCQEGQVGKYVLDQLLLAAPEDLYWSLMNEGLVGEKQQDRWNDTRSRRTWRQKVRVEDLPKRWTRNVRERRR